MLDNPEYWTSVQYMRTPKQRLADISLGRPVEDWLAEQRAEGLPWRRIAQRLLEATDGDIDVTAMTLWTWGTQSRDAA